jgi:D-alanyl-lipoteichoic acid acyltransferase DltB (MBOAT superfamily)
MLPTVPEYYYLVIVVFFAFWLLRNSRAAIVLVCLVNLFCCARWGPIYLLLVPAAATCDFFLARLIERAEDTRGRKLLLAGSIVLNTGLIVFCRYLPRTGLLLPLSLSFYAFQALTYTFDIYRRDSQPIADYLTYISSVTFFPTIVAGPITRVAALAPQWKRREKGLTSEDGSRAFFLIGLGLIKKLLVADYLAGNLINRVFDLPTLYSGGDALAAVYGYAFQLYYDFSGYSDIATGTALLIGIRLPANFNLPYRASNIADFWRRWHITFSHWLRDYLYFSLPGPRTRAMPYVNLVITMAVGGLWHGVAWTFLIWGLLHGAALALYRMWQALRKDRKPASGLAGRIAGGVLTFHFVLFTWIFFRAASVEAAMQILRQIASLRFSFENATPGFLAVLAIAAAAHFTPRSWHEFGLRKFALAPAFVQAGALALLLMAVRLVSSAGAAPFIYSKF